MTSPHSPLSDDQRARLRQLPQIDRLRQLEAVESAAATAPPSAILAALRGLVDELRQSVVANALSAEEFERELETSSLERSFARRLDAELESEYPRAVNATGVILHTGLGRAVLAPTAIKSLAASLRGYTVVEVDRETGERNRRESSLAGLLGELTGAEAATVVNNNAAATLLLLASLAREREVIVSRGELVEIGGSFRIPDILRESGARLVEVGTTNRTYVRDYENAIGPETGLLLQVHTSNYAVRGFTHTPELAELVALGRDRGIPVVSDLGSGCFVDLSPYGFEPEPLVRDRVLAGADAVCFSGDKLLGGPQAGIIVGRKDAVEAARRHPLFRALRVDKATLVLLESTLRTLRDPDRLESTHPTLRCVMQSADAVKRRAEGCAKLIAARAPEWRTELVASAAQAGSGALPDQEIPSWALALHHPRLAPAAIAKALRTGRPPVFGRIQADAFQLDFRTVLPGETELIADALGRLSE